MRATNFFLFLLIYSSSAFAQSEYWGIFQFKKELSNLNLILFEYIQRDKTTFFENKNLDLTRLSYGGQIYGWNYLIGGAYINFSNSDDERRLHQFLLKNFPLTSSTSAFFRLGLEQRDFNNDNHLYFRARTRFQLYQNLYSQFGLSTYDEMFFTLNGHSRFKSGLNENRFGLGLRFKTEKTEFYLFNVWAELRNLKSTTRPQWIQFQTLISF